MLRVNFIEYILTDGIIYTGVEETNGFAWHFYMNPYKLGGTQMLMEEEICKAEADIHCKKLGIRKLPAEMFDC